MTNTTLYIIRHGETEANKTGVLMGSTDTPLNDKGRAQAAQLHQRTQGLEVDLICASPLSRTLETGSIVFGDSAEITTDSNLQEFHFGDWEGMHFKEIAKQYPDIWEMWLTDWEQTQIPGAESFAGFKQRVITMVEQMVQSHAGKRLAVVSHGGCIRTLLAHFFSESVSKGYWQFKVDNATLTEIEFMGELPILTRFNYR
ncbi:alpha-ribazole phosphatase [Desulfobulbus rhabdoformis]|jgi:alpha-ribazole phosphatase|uniref:alpha-ribazole phosphatase n=1 Tax=Desulfobulbus rhabdoformis TaxID=34032 RepID=UPI00196540B8|nr:alpha-ribazole phosphatase [Desulfobulbus rhabdoformis]MBM9616788.1 alpha-ribazole phosphatase [Desulfobulbus rhabdoformis]